MRHPEPFTLPDYFFQSRLRRLRGFPPQVAAKAWAQQEVGHAQLGDKRLTERLVAHLAHASCHPAGTLTQMYGKDRAGRDAAYKFHENERVSAAQIALAQGQATSTRCEGFEYVFVAVDGSSLSYDDPDGDKGLGSVGTYRSKARGLKFMTAMAMSPDGVPMGLLAQAWWLRPTVKPKKPSQGRKVNDKETRYWMLVMEEARERLSEGVVPWFQLDREGDSWPILLAAVDPQVRGWVTIRAKSDRVLMHDESGQDDEEPGGKLWLALGQQPVAATWQVEVPGAAKRKARTATMTLRWRKVTLRLRNGWTKTTYPASVWAVLAREEGTTPAGEKPLEWMLLTTHPVESVKEACLVLWGYAQRWRIEEFHAALKERGCQVEDSLMGSEANLRRFAITSSSVAMRLVRLSYLGRKHPELPASAELTEVEQQALRWLDPRRLPNEPLTMGEVMRALGDLGGHAGSYETRPVGFKVLARG